MSAWFTAKSILAVYGDRGEQEFIVKVPVGRPLRSVAIPYEPDGACCDTQAGKMADEARWLKALR